MTKLTKNEGKVLEVISKHKEIEQPKLLEEMNGDYKNSDSKRVCVSIALNGLMKKKMIKKVDRIKGQSGIPVNVWQAI